METSKAVAPTARFSNRCHGWVDGSEGRMLLQYVWNRPGSQSTIAGSFDPG